MLIHQFVGRKGGRYVRELVDRLISLSDGAVANGSVLLSIPLYSIEYLQHDIM